MSEPTVSRGKGLGLVDGPAGSSPIRWPPPQVDLEVAAELSHTLIPGGVVGTGGYCPDTLVLVKTVSTSPWSAG